MITIVDYGIGNTGSVAKMLQRVGATSSISSDPDTIAQADALILPGVGAHEAAMGELSKRDLLPALHNAAIVRKVPILGICLGMQLPVDGSDEGGAPGLGWIPGWCHRLAPGDSLRVPQMGWNYLEVHQSHPFVKGTTDRSRFYFIHSYAVVCESAIDVVATCDYGEAITAFISRDNISGVQFHPEKSHKHGMEFFRQFVANSDPLTSRQVS